MQISLIASVYRIIQQYNEKIEHKLTKDPLYSTMNVTFVLLCIIPVMASLASCVQTPTTYQLHYDINNPERIKFSNNILLIPADVTIKERFPGGVIEEIPSWTSTSNKIITQTLKQYLASTLGIHSTILQPDNNTSLVQSHTALLKVVNREIRIHTRGWNNWPHKHHHFDYSIGSGLNFLRSHDTDTAIVMNGFQFVEVAKYDSGVANINAYPTNQLTFGTIRFNISLIELDSGIILWNNIDKFSSIDIRQSNGVEAMLTYALESFPVSLFANK